MRKSLIELVGKLDSHGAIAASCFSSNFVRITSLALAAWKNGRKVAYDIHINMSYLYSRRFLVAHFSATSSLARPAATSRANHVRYYNIIVNYDLIT